jgi:hypothetical protein
MIWEILRGAPLLTVVLAGLAGLVAATISLYGWRAWHRWKLAIRDLETIQRDLGTSPYASLTHRDIHRAFGTIRQYLEGLLPAAPAGASLLRPILVEVAQYRVPSVIGGESGWDELLARHLERSRRPLRWMRAAAGWVVLLGLAGTVLGFFEALPRLSGAFAAGAQTVSAPNAGEPAPAVAPESGAERPVPSAARMVIPVLGSLGGVFLATLAGVSSALCLYVLALAFEPRYEKLAGEVEILGRRWLIPLMQSPETVLDEAVRKELGDYVVGLSQQLVGALGPLIDSFSTALGKMSTAAEGFSVNIERGRETLGSFQTAVEILHHSAVETGTKLIGITATSRRFLEHMQKLEQQGNQRLLEAADLLTAPARSLAGSAEGLRKVLESIAQDAERLRVAAAQMTENQALEMAQLREFAASLEKIYGVLASNTATAFGLSKSLDRSAKIQGGVLQELRQFAHIAPEMAGLRQNLPRVERLLTAQESYLEVLVTSVRGLPELAMGAMEVRLGTSLARLAQDRKVTLELLQSNLAAIEEILRGLTAPSAALDPALRAIADRVAESTKLNRKAFLRLESVLLQLESEIEKLGTIRSEVFTSSAHNKEEEADTGSAIASAGAPAGKASLPADLLAMNEPQSEGNA